MGGKRKRQFLLLCAALLWAAGAAQATPIWWDVGDPGSTYQEWGFGGDANPTPADNPGDNPFGESLATITSSGESHGFPAGWKDSWLGRQGVWTGDFTSILLYVPNEMIQRPMKEIWVEVEFRGYVLPDPERPEYGDEYGPDVNAWVGNNQVPDSAIAEIGRTIEALPDGWKKLTIGWHVYPNPDYEEIYLAFADSGADVDYVKVWTICFPEPLTVFLLGIGGIVCTRLRRG